LLFSATYMLGQDCASLHNAPLLGSQILFIGRLYPLELPGDDARPRRLCQHLNLPGLPIAGLRLVIAVVGRRESKQRVPGHESPSLAGHGEGQFAAAITAKTAVI